MADLDFTSNDDGLLSEGQGTEGENAESTLPRADSFADQEKSSRARAPDII